MRTVSRLTRADRQKRAWRYTDRALKAGLTRAHEAEQKADQDAFAAFCADLDCIALKVLPLETLRNIHRRCLPLAQTVR